MEEWKQVLYAKHNQPRVGVAVLMSDKIDFKKKSHERQKACINKRLDIAKGINFHTPNNRPAIHEAKFDKGTIL